MKTNVKVRELIFKKDTRLEHDLDKVYFSIRILFDDLSSEFLVSDDIFIIRSIIEKYLFVDKAYNKITDITKLD